MNWSRSGNRIGKWQHEKKQQREFFERQKFMTTVKRIKPLSPTRVKRRGISQDLLSLQTVNRAHDHHPFKDVQNTILKVDLNEATPQNRKCENIDLGPLSPGKNVTSKLDIMDTRDRCLEDKLGPTKPKLPKCTNLLESENVVPKVPFNNMITPIDMQSRKSWSSSLSSSLSQIHNDPVVYSGHLAPKTPFQPYSKPGPKVSFSTKLRYNDSFDGEHKTLSAELWKAPAPSRHFWEQETPILMGKINGQSVPSKLPLKPVKFDSEVVIPTTSSLMNFGDFLKNESSPSRNLNFLHFSSTNAENPLKHNSFKRQVPMVQEDFQMTPLQKYDNDLPLRKYRKRIESQKHKRNSPQEKCKKKIETHIWESPLGKYQQNKDISWTEKSNYMSNSLKGHSVLKISNTPSSIRCDAENLHTDSVLDILDDGKFNKEHAMSQDYFCIDFDKINKTQSEKPCAELGNEKIIGENKCTPTSQIMIDDKIKSLDTLLCQIPLTQTSLSQMTVGHGSAGLDENSPSQTTEESIASPTTNTDERDKIMITCLNDSLEPAYRKRLFEMLMGTPATAQYDAEATAQNDAPVSAKSGAPATTRCDTQVTLGCSSIHSINEPQEASEGHIGYTTSMNSSLIDFVKGASMTRNNMDKTGTESEIKDNPVQAEKTFIKIDREQSEREDTLNELICLEAEDEQELHCCIDMEEEIEDEARTLRHLLPPRETEMDLVDVYHGTDAIIPGGINHPVHSTDKKFPNDTPVTLIVSDLLNYIIDKALSWPELSVVDNQSMIRNNEVARACNNSVECFVKSQCSDNDNAHKDMWSKNEKRPLTPIDKSVPAHHTLCTIKDIISDKLPVQRNHGMDIAEVDNIQGRLPLEYVNLNCKISSNDCVQPKLHSTDSDVNHQPRDALQNNASLGTEKTQEVTAEKAVTCHILDIATVDKHCQTQPNRPTVNSAIQTDTNKHYNHDGQSFIGSLSVSTQTDTTICQDREARFVLFQHESTQTDKQDKTAQKPIEHLPNQSNSHLTTTQKNTIAMPLSDSVPMLHNQQDLCSRYSDKINYSDQRHCIDYPNITNNSSGEIESHEKTGEEPSIEAILAQRSRQLEEKHNMTKQRYSLRSRH